MRMLSYLFFLLSVEFATAQSAENVFLITLDGLRWQEVYGGAVDSMLNNSDLTHEKDVIEQFSDSNPKVAREKLMPWLWNTVAKQGQLYGNRWEGNKMSCTNRYWFSYPGYNEILTGYSDPHIDSNEKKNNPNVTVLEWLNKKPAFKDKVAAFGSWDVFPFIINTERSGIPVNAGFQKAEGNDLTEKEKTLNELQEQIPSPWSSVRLDAFTHNFMMEYVKKKKPRVVYIAYGETDDFAHDGRYDLYLKSAHRTDQFIKEIWDYIQSQPEYQNKTTLLITTDHGRGNSPMTEWSNHGTKTKESNEIWLAAIGPEVTATGVQKNGEKVFQNQIAATLAAILGFKYHAEESEVGDTINGLFKE